MKKEVGLFIPAFISIGLMILLVLTMTHELKVKKAKEKETNKIEYVLEIEPKDDCKDVDVYTEDIKTYCIKEIYYNRGKEKTSLRSALQEDITMDFFIKNMELISDKETKYELYYDTKQGSLNFYVLKCNNKYLISTKEIDNPNGYCE
jgi:hypothetical protein